MPVQCTRYISNGEKWGSKLSHENKSSGSPLQHAERQVMTVVKKTDTCLLVQNAFPCANEGSHGGAGCHGYLQSIANMGTTIIVRVDEDQAGYSAWHKQNGLPTPPVMTFPWAILYQKSQPVQYFQATGPQPAALARLPNIWTAKAW